MLYFTFSKNDIIDTIYKTEWSYIMDKEVLLETKDLHTAFRIGDEYYDAVDDVNLSLYSDEVLAIVGESGCGKSTLATTIMGLHDFNYTRVSGQVIFEGKNILENSEDEYNKIRGGKIGMIFQDPLSALNPLQRIGAQIEEALIYHTDLDEKQRLERVEELLTRILLYSSSLFSNMFLPSKITCPLTRV